MWVLLFVFLFFLTLFCIWIQKTYSKYRKFPPGPIRWPLVGSIPQMLMIDRMFLHKQLMALSNEYGPIMSIGIATHFTVVLNTYEMMNDLFTRPESIERFPSPYSKERSNGENLGIIWGSGAVGKTIKKFTIKSLREFGFGKVRTMEETFKEEIDMLLADIKEEISATGGIWSVDPNRLSIVAVNLVWSSVGGYRFDQNSDLIKEHIRLSKEVSVVLQAASLLMSFPFLQIFPEWSGYNRIKHLDKRLKNFMKELIEDAKSKRQSRAEPGSFVEVFLDEIEKNKENPKSYMTENQLITILMDLFLAGSDTTGTALNWLILYFAIYQRVQNKVRQEMQLASENWTTCLTVAQASCLPYLRCSIYETFRHSSFIAVPTPRIAYTDIVIDKYCIPKGACMIFNLHASSHEKSYWGENVDEFLPERFLNSMGTAPDPVKVERLAQFGFAPRHCPGEKIALDTLAAAALGFLANFQIGLVEGRQAKLELSNSSVIINPKPYVVMLEPLRHTKILRGPT